MAIRLRWLRFATVSIPRVGARCAWLAIAATASPSSTTFRGCARAKPLLAPVRSCVGILR